jgi:phospholipid transport system substrate-binding protein
MSKHVVVRSRSLRSLTLALPLLVGTVGLWIGAAATVVQAAPLAPRATLQRLNGSVDKLLRQKTESGSAEEKRVKEEIKQRASELLDYTELTKRALGEHWEKMPPAKREEFVATLRQLIERNYIKQLRTNLDYEVTYGDEVIDQATGGSEARVYTTIKIATRGKSTSAPIEYRMIRRESPKEGARWMVYDVITDELSLVRNYRTQFVKIIGSQGYDGLLNRMKTKLNEELAAEAAANKSPDKAPDKTADKAAEKTPEKTGDKAAEKDAGKTKQPAKALATPK